jgi:hypothetical protein|tara:strand:- start:778 stop:1110 length:333 start_codon:yes stop_codon:yes gene_type:complete
MTLQHRPSSSYFIEIQPKMLDSDWTGELEVNIITSQNNPLPEESRAHMLHLCQLVASTVALMERRPALIDELEDFLGEEETYYKEQDKKKVTTTVKDNVITLKFNKETKH